MHLLRTRLVSLIAACAVAVALPACGDDDGKGAAEEIEKGAKKGADEIKKEGKEFEDDARGTDEKKQKKQKKQKTY